MKVELNMQAIDATLERCRVGERAAFKLTLADLMLRKRYLDARGEILLHTMDGTISQAEGAAALREVRKAERAANTVLVN